MGRGLCGLAWERTSDELGEANNWKYGKGCKLSFRKDIDRRVAKRESGLHIDSVCKKPQRSELRRGLGSGVIGNSGSFYSR